MSGSAADRRRDRRTGRLAVAGLVLAAVAEASSTALIGLSGWFVSACAVAGAATFSSFSYIAPSGGVRAFALTRIAGNYVSRLLLHAAALRRVADVRARFFGRAARADDAVAGAWSGELLDRSMADADSAGMSLIRSVEPATTAAAMAAAGVLAVGLAGSSVSAAVLLGGAVVVAGLAKLTPARAARDEQGARNALRAEVVTAVEAWGEMASLGATSLMVARTRNHFERLLDARHSVAAHRSRVAVGTALVGTLCLTVLLVATARATTDPAKFVFVALISAGVLSNAHKLVAAAGARDVTADARVRLHLDRSSTAAFVDQAASPAMTACVTASTVGFVGYRLPSTPERLERSVSAHVPRGGLLVVTGRSGTGKSTLLRALADMFAASPGLAGRGRRVTLVAAEDYLFTGTIGDNLRLAEPTLTERQVHQLLADFWLDRAGLDADTPVGHAGRDLSGGEQRRLFLARGLATGAHVLVVDEPTTGLDEKAAAHVLRVLASLPDVTVIVATHTPPRVLPKSADITMLCLD